MPTEMGRITRLQGGVFLGRPGDARPSVGMTVAAGDDIRTASDGGATLEIGTATLRLAGDTRLTIRSLDDGGLVLAERAGELAMSLPAGTGRPVRVDTARGTVRATGATATRFGIAAGQDGIPTAVGVAAGTVTMAGQGYRLTLSAGRQADIAGASPFTVTVASLAADVLLRSLPEPRDGRSPPPAATPAESDAGGLPVVTGPRARDEPPATPADGPGPSDASPGRGRDPQEPVPGPVYGLDFSRGIGFQPHVGRGLAPAVPALPLAPPRSLPLPPNPAVR